MATGSRLYRNSRATERPEVFFPGTFFWSFGHGPSFMGYQNDGMARGTGLLRTVASSRWKGGRPPFHDPRLQRPLPPFRGSLGSRVHPGSRSHPNAIPGGLQTARYCPPLSPRKGTLNGLITSSGPVDNPTFPSNGLWSFRGSVGLFLPTFSAGLGAVRLLIPTGFAPTKNVL